MALWLSHDIISILNEFIIDYYTLYNLHCTCSTLFYYRFKNIKIDHVQILPEIGTIVKAECHSNIKLKHRPFFRLTDLTYLDLEYASNITDHSLSNLTKLTYLNCGKNKINGKIFWHLPNLTHLYLGRGQINAITLARLSKLTHLDCTYANIRNPSQKSLKMLTNLTHLKCGKNEIFTPDVIQNYTKLEYLVCPKYDYYLRTSIDTAIKHLVNLKYLDCTYANCTGVGSLQYLTQLVTLLCNIDTIESLDDCGNIIPGFINMYKNSMPNLVSVHTFYYSYYFYKSMYFPEHRKYSINRWQVHIPSIRHRTKN